MTQLLVKLANGPEDLRLDCFGCHSFQLTVGVQVKNFCNEDVESNKLGSAIGNYQKAEYTMVISFNVISLLQGTIVFGATVLGLVLCVKVRKMPSASCLSG